ASGGQQPYQYKIGSGSYGSSNVYSNLSAGTYFVTVKDALGATTQIQVDITEPAPVTVSVSASGAASFCQGGSVTLSAPAGFSRYLWSNSATSSSITVSVSGSYSVTVTNSNGCQGTSSATTVTVYAKPVNPTVTNGSRCGAGIVSLS